MENRSKTMENDGKNSCFGSFWAAAAPRTVSPKGEWLHAVAEDNMLYSFSVASGGLEQTLKVAEKEIIGLTHHPTRNIVAGFAGDGTMVFMKA